MKNHYLITAFALFAFACSTADIEPEAVINPSVDTTPSERYLSPEEAGSLATAFMASLENDGIKSRSEVVRKISDVSLLNLGSLSRSTDSDTTFYVVNFEEGGYSLVAADRELCNKIYIYSFDGIFDDNRNPIVEYYIQNAIETMPEAPRYGESYLKSSNISRKPVDPDPTLPASGEEMINGVWYIYYIYGNSSNKVLPLKTKWVQGHPYNSQCPGYLTETDYPAAGCVAIAMGQICAYHKWPQSLDGHTYNWDQMLLSSTHKSINAIGVYDISHLLAGIGGLVNMDYGFQSGTTINWALTGFKNLGFSSAKIESFSSSACINSINNNLPVYIRGSNSTNVSGHAWIIDGYTIETSIIDYYNKETGEPFVTVNGPSSVFLHFNCGWNDDSDTYYYTGSNEPNKHFSTFAFGYNNQIITEIKR